MRSLDVVEYRSSLTQDPPYSNVYKISMSKNSPSLAIIKPPNGDDWAEILKNFDLSENRENQLRQGVVEIANDINKDIAFERRASQGRGRKETNKHFRNISKALRKLETIICDDDPNSNKTLSELFGRELADLLGNRGLARLLPGHPGPQPPSIHDLDSHESERHDGPYEALDDGHYLSERERIARSAAPMLLQSLAAALNQPLNQFLEVRRQAKGGNPGLRYRNYVVQQLAILYRNVFKQKPTGTRPGQLPKNAQFIRTGRFVLLCELILDAYGMDTTGVEKAVDRTLTRLDL